MARYFMASPFRETLAARKKEEVEAKASIMTTSPSSRREAPAHRPMGKRAEKRLRPM
jgi:hypothetical protein